MKTLSIGKFRGLQQCSTPRRAIAVLALDHRNNLRASLRPAAPDTVTPAELTAFKLEVVRALSPHASAVLLDPQVGAGQCIAEGVVPGGVGMLIACEASGYTGDAAARRSGLLPDWSITKVRRMGANAVKLLVYYHPQSPTASEIETLVRQVAADCAASDLPLFLEPLSYPLDPQYKKLPPGEIRSVVIETARRLCPLGVDLLKAEFPLDFNTERDEKVWAGACAELSEAAGIPWVLLSAAADFETFLRMVTAACQNGASGVAVGRAVWKEATGIPTDERQAFLTGVAALRMARVTALCNALARPWTQLFAPPCVDSNWYTTY